MEESLYNLIGDYISYQEDVKYIYLYTETKLDSENPKLIYSISNLILKKYPNYLKGSLKIKYIKTQGLKISFIPENSTYFRLIPMELVALINFNLSESQNINNFSQCHDYRYMPEFWKLQLGWIFPDVKLDPNIDYQKIFLFIEEYSKKIINSESIFQMIRGVIDIDPVFNSYKITQNDSNDILKLLINHPLVNISYKEIDFIFWGLDEYDNLYIAEYLLSIEKFKNSMLTLNRTERKKLLNNIANPNIRKILGKFYSVEYKK